MRYEPKYFSIEELVPHDALDKYGEARCWWLMDDRILKVADLLREDFGALVCNNWSTGGNFSHSGFRIPKYDRYSVTSQHAHGRALDLKPKRCTAQDMREAIMQDRERYGVITGLEMDVSWLHIDCRSYDGLLKFYPPKAKGRPKKGEMELPRDLR